MKRINYPLHKDINYITFAVFAYASDPSFVVPEQQPFLMLLRHLLNVNETSPLVKWHQQ